MHDRVHLSRNIDGFRHIMFDQLEMRIGREVRNVLPRSGDEIIQPNHIVAFGQESVAEMRSDKPRGSA